MKKLKFLKIFAMVLVLSMVSTDVLPLNNAVIAQAATVKISDKSLLLQIGQSETLKITGSKAKVAWISSKKSVATVDKNGKVTAKKAGTAIITATVNNKKYTCEVTAFNAMKLTSDDVNYVIPEDWTSTVLPKEENNTIIIFNPSSENMTKGASNIKLLISKTGTAKPDDKTAKANFDSIVSEEFIKEQLALLGVDTKVSDYRSETYASKLGTAHKASYNFTIEGYNVTQTIYIFYTDNYLFQIIATGETSTTLDMNTMAEYIIDSIKVFEDEDTSINTDGTSSVETEVIAGFVVPKDIDLKVFIPDDDRVEVKFMLNVLIPNYEKQITDMAKILSQKCDDNTVKKVVTYVSKKKVRRDKLEEKFIFDDKTQRCIWIMASGDTDINVCYLTEETSKIYKNYKN